MTKGVIPMNNDFFDELNNSEKAKKAEEPSISEGGLDSF